MRIASAIVCLFTVVACDQQKVEPEPVAVISEKAEVAEAQPTAVAAVTPDGAGDLHNVACACSLGEEKTCGNMIEVDGRYLPLAGETGLEQMAFCGKAGVKAKVEGKVDGEKFVATSVQLVEPAAK